MPFIRRHWYSLGLVFLAAAVAGLVALPKGSLRFILLLNFAVLLCHQFEEYAWPGGEPWITNQVMQPKGDRPDRYPLNQNNAWFMNVPAAYAFYLLAVFFPGVLWLGMAPTLFGFGQLIVHGVITNRRLKTVYNPGLAAVVFGHLPVGVWYLITVYSGGAVPLWNWLLAVFYMALFMGVVMMRLGYGVLAGEDSGYPFAPEEMERFDRQGHLARIKFTESVGT